MKILQIAPIALGFSLIANAQAGGGATGVVYTCDPSITAVAGFCNTLNTTIAGIYASTFLNANANIYITFGSIPGDNGVAYPSAYHLTYPAYRTALQQSLTSPNDAIAFASSVPATNPINANDQVRVAGALMRALGMSITDGLTSDHASSCTLGAAGCYDGVIVLSSANQAAGTWFYRNGIIGGSQLDIYRTVQHETDHVLGWDSCVGGCTSDAGVTLFATPDLFRYQSNGSRTFAPGNNGPCANGNVGNACFSLDGVHYLEQFNNLSGSDYADWALNCNNYLVQTDGGCFGISGVNIAPNAEIAALDVIGYTLAGYASSTAYFSDLVFGGGFQSTLTYINYSTQAVTCTTTFHSDAGAPLSIPFQQGSVSTRTDTLQPGQSIHDQTLANLTAASVEGWAQASCTGPVEASLLYRYYTNGVATSEAGVNAETAPTTSFVTFAQTATGVAYANPSPNLTATVTFTVFSGAGVKLGSTTLTLAPLAHGSSNVGPLLGLASFTGMLEITSTIPIISLSLNAEAFPVISSLPPGDLPAGFVGGGGQTNYYFSDLAFGGGFQSTFTLINYSAQSVTCVTNFYSDAGGPLSVPFAQGAVSTRTDVLPAGASIHDQTIASLGATTAEGWAQSSCTGAIQASLLYRYSTNGAAVSEAGVNAETAPTTKFATFAQTATGVSYANPSTTQSATVTFSVYSTAGAKLGSQIVTLGPLQHSAANLGPLLGLTSFTGFVKITSTIPIISLSLNAEAFPVISSLPPGDLPSLTTLVP